MKKYKLKKQKTKNIKINDIQRKYNCVNVNDDNSDNKESMFYLK